MYFDELGELMDKSVIGYFVLGVLGFVVGFVEMYCELGLMDWLSFVLLVVVLVDGYEIDELCYCLFEYGCECFVCFEMLKCIFFIEEGEVFFVGMQWQQFEFVKVFWFIVNDGFQVFYEGEIVDFFVVEMECGGGIIIKQDFVDYFMVWCELIEVDYCGYMIYFMLLLLLGGIMLVMILNIFEGYGQLLVFGSMEFMYLQVEVMCCVFIDCNCYFGDLDFFELLIECFQFQEYVDEL